MAKAEYSAVIEFPVQDVWALVGEFHGIGRWVGSIAASEPVGPVGNAVGSVRRLTLADGRMAAERLSSYDDVKRSLSYDFVGEPLFPVDGFLGTVQLTPVLESDETFLHWSAVFDADRNMRAKFESVFVNLYAGFVIDLRRHLHGG